MKAIIIKHRLKGVAVLVFVTATLLPNLLLNAANIPLHFQRVNDYAAMITAPVKNDIEAKLKQFEIAESTPIIILTIPSLKGEPIEDFAIRVAEAWMKGQKKTDNGVLLIVSRDDHKVRIEVGYGLESKITDTIAGRITREEIVPAFKLGQFDRGFTKGIASIMQAIRPSYQKEPLKWIQQTQKK